MVGVRQVLRSVLLPPEAPAFAGRRVGLEVGDGLRAHVSRGLEQACVTGAVPPPHRLRGRLRLGLGLRSSPGRCPQALPLHSVQPVAAVLIGWPYRPLEVALQHRPLSPSARCRHEAADWAGGYPLRVVRIAPLHDAGITVTDNCTLRSLLCWAKIHSHACRGASRRSCPLTQVSERTMRTRFVPVCQGRVRRRPEVYAANALTLSRSVMPARSLAS